MRQIVIRTFAAILILCICGLSTTQMARAAAPEGINIQFEVGYDGVVQKCRINPVSVVIDNQSDGVNLSGDLVLNHEGTEYTTRLEVPSPSRKRLFLYFPCSDVTPSLQLTIRTSAYTESMDLSRDFKAIDAGASSIIVLTSQAGSLQAANQVESVRLTRNEWLNPIAELSSSKSSISYFDIDEVDRNAKFFARADAIILADIDYLQLDEQLGSAMMQSVSRGANLIFSMGSNGNKIAASPISSLCPIDYDRVVQVQDLGEFGNQFGIETGTGSATLAVGNLKEDAEVVSYAGAYPAIVKQNWGAGTVQALAFSFTDRPFRQHPALGDLFSSLTMDIEQSVDVSNWFIHPQDIFNVMENLEEAKPMEPGFVALFIILYVVLVGPVNFLFLSRIKKRTLVWLTIPILIIGFSWFGLETGRITRGADNIVASFQELHIYPGTPYVPYQDATYVFTAEPVRYDLEVQDSSSFLYTTVPTYRRGDNFGMSNIGRGGVNPFITESLDNSLNPRIRISQGKWQPKEYYFRGYREIPVMAKSAITTPPPGSSGKIEPTGTFELDLPFSLTECSLFGMGNYTREAGNIDGKGVYNIEDLKIASSTLGVDNYLADYTRVLRENQASASGKGLLYRDELLLVGFTEDVERLAEFDRRHIQHSMAMVVVHLPMDVKRTTTGKFHLSRKTKLTGGLNFKLYNQHSRYMGQMYSFDASIEYPKYEIAKDGYLDMELEFDGQPSRKDYIDLSARLFEIDNSEVRYSDAKPFLLLEGLSATGRWVNIPFQAGTDNVKLPLGLLQDDNSMHIRYRAIQDAIVELPEVLLSQ